MSWDPHCLAVALYWSAEAVLLADFVGLVVAVSQDLGASGWYSTGVSVQDLELVPELGTTDHLFSRTVVPLAVQAPQQQPAGWQRVCFVAEVDLGQFWSDSKSSMTL